MHTRFTMFLHALCLCVWMALTGCGAGNAPPDRHGVVSFSPNITETVFALGEGDRVVAVTDFCDYPPAAQALPRIGGYINPSLEKLTLLQPALVMVPGQHPRVTDYADQFDIPVLNVHMDSLATIEAGIRTIGDALECPDRADGLWRDIRAELDAVADAVEGRPRPRVLLINARASHDLNALFTVGGPSFLSELLTIAGGENIFADESEAYFEASKESVTLAQPEVILEFHAGEGLSDAEQQRYADDWDVLGTLPAVQQDRVVIVTESYSLRPGPRIGLTAAAFARILHPDTDVPAP